MYDDVNKDKQYTWENICDIYNRERINIIM